MFLTVLAAIFLAALINIDRQACGQFMLSRPLISGLIMGLFLGEPIAGIWLGVSLELLWLAALPLGGTIPPNSSLSLSSLIIAWALTPFSGEKFADTSQGLVICFLLNPLWAYLFIYLEKWNRYFADKRYVKILKKMENKEATNFFRQNIKGLFISFGLSIIALSLTVFINYELLSFLSYTLPISFYVAIKPLLSFIPFLGLIAMAVFMDKKYLYFYLAAIGAGVLVG